MNRRKAAAKGDLAKLIWCFIGVVGTLIIYGIGQVRRCDTDGPYVLQSSERIMKFPYGDRDEDSEYFQHSLFIVLCNRLMTCAVAVIVHLVTGASLALVAPIYAYGAVSLSNVISSGCQYEALKYVSFPLQTIAKSSRMVPVLIWGTIISRKQYKPREYIIAITIILGSCLFFLNVGKAVHAWGVWGKAVHGWDEISGAVHGWDEISGAVHGWDEISGAVHGWDEISGVVHGWVTAAVRGRAGVGQSAHGIPGHVSPFLSAGFLCVPSSSLTDLTLLPLSPSFDGFTNTFDGFTNTFQDKLFEGYDMPAANQVLYITLCSSVISLLGLRQDLAAAIAFIMRHPDCALHIAVLSVAATISQFFISYTIKTFGALTFATIMTTRQLLSIVLSSTVYGPPLSSTQQVGTPLLFVPTTALPTAPPHSLLHHRTPYCTTALPTAPPHSLLHHRTPYCTTALPTAPPHSLLHHRTPYCTTALPTAPPHSLLHHRTPYCTTALPTAPPHSLLHHRTPYCTTALPTSPPHSLLHHRTPYCTTALPTAPPHSLLHHRTPYCTTALPTAPPHSLLHHRTPYCTTALPTAPPHSLLHHRTPYCTTALPTAPPHSLLHHRTPYCTTALPTSSPHSLLHHRTPYCTTALPTAPPHSLLHHRTPYCTTALPTAPPHSLLHHRTPYCTTALPTAPPHSLLHHRTPYCTTSHQMAVFQ
ncbi:unnamed protein product [Closterium sp. NIES-65]|nr:unnamed protein product [Closterium sp. NIES-65]